jgi:ATP-binding cassette subfamily B protein
MSGARRILDLMSRETKLDQNTAGREGRMEGEIEFRAVSFRYPATARTDTKGDGAEPAAKRGEPVLEEVSFHVRPGQTVAIVGQTGAAKTSLVRLVNRTYDVSSGQVLIDGVDVREWNLAALRSQISMIEQDIFLFSRSLQDNIAFGKPGATREQAVTAAKAAQADEFIESFEKGYETPVGERGVTLSGGQRQRIALARAFLVDPRILILDDSTSAIDSATEDRIQQAIAQASRGRTTLIITHRLSQIRWADLILVMRRGRIAAMGTHEELMRTSDAYARIFSE